MDEIKETLRTYILDRFLPGEKRENLKDDTPLRSSSILDSLATLDVVAFVEETFGIELEAHETGTENFDRIEDIARLIVRKRG